MELDLQKLEQLIEDLKKQHTEESFDFEKKFSELNTSLVDITDIFKQLSGMLPEELVNIKDELDEMHKSLDSMEKELLKLNDLKGE